MSDLTEQATFASPAAPPVLLDSTPPAAEREFAAQLLSALLRFKAGDFTSHLPAHLSGLDGKIADVFNEVLDVSARRAMEISRVCRVVGKEGKLKQRMSV